MTEEYDHNRLGWIGRLGPDQRKLIDDSTRDVTYKEGQLIYHEGSIPEGVYFVKDGTVQLVSFDASGDERVLGFFGPITSFGETALFARRKHRFSAIAKTKLRLGFLPRTRLLQIASESAEITGRILESVAWRHNIALEIRLERERLGLEERLASALLKLLQMQSAEGSLVEGRTEYPLKLTQGDIASVLGASRQSINKIMRQWCDEQIIRLEYGQIIVTALERIEHYSRKACGTSSVG